MKTIPDRDLTKNNGKIHPSQKDRTSIPIPRRPFQWLSHNNYTSLDSQWLVKWDHTFWVAKCWGTLNEKRVVVVVVELVEWTGEEMVAASENWQRSFLKLSLSSSSAFVRQMIQSTIFYRWPFGDEDQLRENEQLWEKKKSKKNRKKERNHGNTRLWVCCQL